MQKTWVPALVNSNSVKIEEGTQQSRLGMNSQRGRREAGKWGVESQKPQEDSFSKESIAPEKAGEILVVA